MNDLNSVFMVGRIVSDVKVKTVKERSTVSFKLENNYMAFDEEEKEYKKETSVYNVVLNGRNSEKLEPYMKVGKRVGVNGRLQVSAKIIKIIAYTIQLLDTKTEEIEETK